MPGSKRKQRKGGKQQRTVQWVQRPTGQGEDTPPVYKGDGSKDDAGDGYGFLSERIRLPPFPDEKADLLTLVWIGPPSAGKTGGAYEFGLSWHIDDPGEFNFDTAVIIFCEDLLDAIHWIQENGLDLKYFWVIIDDALDKQDGRTASNREQIDMLNIYEKLRHYFPGMRGTKFVLNYTTQIDTLDPRIRNNALANLVTSNPGDYPRRRKLYSMWGYHPWLTRKLKTITKDFRNKARGGAARGEFVFWTDVPEYGFFSLVKYHSVIPEISGEFPETAPRIVDLRHRGDSSKQDEVLEVVEAPGEVSLFPLVERVGERIGWGLKPHIFRTEISRMVIDESEDEYARMLAKKALQRGNLNAVKEYYKTLSVERGDETAQLEALVRVLLALSPDRFYRVREQICPMLGDDMGIFHSSTGVAEKIRKFSQALERKIKHHIHIGEKVRHENKSYLIVSKTSDVVEARRRARTAFRDLTAPGSPIGEAGHGDSEPEKQAVVPSQEDAEVGQMLATHSLQ